MLETLEVLEAPEVMRCVLGRYGVLCMLEAVEGRIFVVGSPQSSPSFSIEGEEWQYFLGGQECHYPVLQTGAHSL